MIWRCLLYTLGGLNRMRLHSRVPCDILGSFWFQLHYNCLHIHNWTNSIFNLFFNLWFFCNAGNAHWDTGMHVGSTVYTFVSSLSIGVSAIGSRVAASFQFDFHVRKDIKKGWPGLQVCCKAQQHCFGVLSRQIVDKVDHLQRREVPALLNTWSSILAMVAGVGMNILGSTLHYQRPSPSFMQNKRILVGKQRFHIHLRRCVRHCLLSSCLCLPVLLADWPWWGASRQVIRDLDRGAHPNLLLLFNI